LTEYQPLPQPDDIPIREREDAMGAYFMMFASVAIGFPFPIVNLIAAVVYYFLNRKKSAFVHFHSLQSLLSQLPTSLINWGAVFILIRIFFYDDDFDNFYKGYFGMALMANLFYFIFSIIAAIKARNGKVYYFLFFGSFSYHHVFKIRPEKNPERSENLPPRL
jgi:uncharacterized Tic20 family protein